MRTSLTAEWGRWCAPQVQEWLAPAPNLLPACPPPHPNSAASHLPPAAPAPPCPACSNLNCNNLSGPIPDAWSTNYSFQSVLEVHMADNQLTGSLQAWAESQTAWYSLLVW